jgi:hypothetical protein
MGFMRWLQGVWHFVREPFLFLRPIRFVVLPLLVLLWALTASDEGQDAIRAVIEFDPVCSQWMHVTWFVFWVFLLALQAWYWSRQLLLIDFPRCVRRTADENEHQQLTKTTAALAEKFDSTEQWTPRIIGASVFLTAVSALVKAAYSYVGKGNYTTHVATITCIAIGASLLLFLVIVVARRKILGPAQRVQSHHGLSLLTRIILVTTLLLSLSIVVLTAVKPLAVGYLFPAPTLLMLSAAIWIGLGSWTIYWADMYHVPLIGILVALAFLFSPFNDNHAVRKLAPAEGGADIRCFPRRTVAETFKDWYPQAAHGDVKTPVFIVATEGGGIRAAYWTAAVLAAIQDASPAFRDHLFAISGVSGGSVGATAFTAALADHRKAGGACPPPLPTSQLPDRYRFAVQQMLSFDALAPTLASLLHADLVQRFLPIAFIPDRARALETGWERGWENTMSDQFFSGGFLKMYQGRGTASLPSLFLNGTVVETGRRIITSNCKITQCEIQDSDDILSKLESDVRLSTAAHNSARFTYVSPAGTIRNDACDPSGHVVDGGYFENSGALTAADIVHAIRPLGSFPLYVLVIHFQEKNAPSTHPEKFANEVLSPLRALLATRGARGELSVAQAKRMSDIAECGEKDGTNAIRLRELVLTQDDDGGTKLPLGWLLAPRTRNAIDLQIGTTVPAGLSKVIAEQVGKNVAIVEEIAKQLRTQLPLQPDLVQRAAQLSEHNVANPDQAVKP